MKVGVFGGTFDPPHVGHQILAAEALAQINLDNVLWVLTTFPPHKEQQMITSVEYRLRMVQLTIEDNNRFVLSRVDIERDPPYYAVDTVTFLREQAPQDEFYYLMGMDSLNDLSKWHRPVDFVKTCDGIVVMKRKGEKLNISEVEDNFPGIGGKIFFLDTPIMEISSSDIRARINQGEEYRYFVPNKVYQFIEENRLYLY